jgi:WD40 repeat protein
MGESEWCTGEAFRVLSGIWTSPLDFAICGGSESSEKKVGTIKLYKMKSVSKCDLVKQMSLPSASARCLTLSHSRIICGDVIGGIHSIDMNLDTIESFSDFHSGGVQSLDSMGQIIASGGQDARVRLWDSRSFKENILEINASGSSVPECWVVRFGVVGGDHVLFAGWENGDLKRINLSAGSKVDWEENISNNGVSISF